MSRTWRDTAKAVIAQELEKYPHATADEMKKILFLAYPFGEREYHPYRIWCDQVKKTMHVLYRTPIKSKEVINENQQTLF